MLNERSLQYFLLQQNLSIDESMIPYYGRHGAKQFIRGKPVRFGFKMWVLATPLGYAVQFEPYQGARGRQAATCPGLGMGGSVVIDLVSEIQGEDAFHLTFDNLFTSLKLVDYLSSKNIACTGTIRANRIEDCPLRPVKDMGKTPRGTYDYYTDTNNAFTVVRWNDNNVVNVVSNKVGVNPTQKTRRFSRQARQHINIDQPALINHYNKTMGGIDRMDQNIAKYRIAIRSKKWWWSIFAFCLDLAVQQTWHLYRATPTGEENPLDLLAVRRAIATVYLSRSVKQHRVGRPLGRPAQLHKRVAPALRFDGKDHLVERVQKRLRCASCGKKSSDKCIKCNVGLHAKCFAAFHTDG
jgi:DNA excision repair protein ERCC-6